MGATLGVLLKVEGRGVEQDLIPYVGQLELVNIPVEGWIIDPYVCGLLDFTSDVVYLPTHYKEAVHTDVITSDIGMVIDGRRALRCSLRLSS